MTRTRASLQSATPALFRISFAVFVVFVVLLSLAATPASSQLAGLNRLRPVGPPSPPSRADALDITRDHLARNRTSLGLAPDDLGEIVVRDRYRSEKSGLTHLYLRQQIDGIDVLGADWITAIDRDGRLFSQADRLVRDLRGRIETRTPELSAGAALLAAASDLGLATTGPLAVRRSPGGANQKVVFPPSGISRDEIPVALGFVVTNSGAVRICWNLVIRTPEGRHWWNLFVDAENGAILAREDWISQDSYNIYPAPLESPYDGSRSTQINPADNSASPFGWHDTDGAAGAEFSDTRGNNVYAQEDTDANDSGGFRPDGGAPLDFDFPVDPNLHPSSYQAAAISNLFYWNNLLHDVLYQYGFDEAAGNFQQNNYGNGGLAGDPVQADAQDGSDTNNAQFGTPPDGSDPRMEMFLFTQEAGASLEVLSPLAIAGSVAASAAVFGGGTPGLTAPVILALDPADGAGPATTDACSSLTNSGAVAGNIAIVDRGTCLFVEKTANVQAAGGVGIIIANNAGNALVIMSGSDPSLTIPPIFIGQDDGTTIKDQLGTGVSATLITSSPRGSSFDNGIIAHEYGHGLSNRLTGGPGNVGCLNATQSRGMGEGWSDWLALMMTAQGSDTAIQPIPIGTYAVGDLPGGAGIRNHPYSRDLSSSPLTFSDIATLNAPHGIGEVWASALWDLYWNLVDHYGFDSDLYAGTGGNNLLMQMVLDAMKLQACNPSFLDARDALLLADANANAGTNECLIWEAFARRGIGFSATGGSAFSTSVGEAFDEPVVCQNECGDGQLQAGEQCDDGGTQAFDGCAANCRNESHLSFSGPALGGNVIATINGVAVQITTSEDQSATSIAAALAAAINANTALQALYGVADAQGGLVAFSGNLDSLEIHDPGLAPPAVPALGSAARGVLALGLLLSAGWLAGKRSKRERKRLD